MARPKKPEGERARDIPPTGIRLPADLREQLERECAINGTSLSSEIVRRLRSTFPQVVTTGVAVSPTGAVTPLRQEVQPAALSPSQRSLLQLFSQLPPEKQLALLTLIKR